MKSRSLLPILRECQTAIEQARTELAEAARLDYRTTHAAQWLLDNAYLIRSNVADVRRNLPDNHNRILPLLAGTDFPKQVRIYDIAVEFLSSTGYRVTAESIVSFLTAYQHRVPLTIAELWAFPLMLRLVLLRRLQQLSEEESARQHQKEVADFWADRVLNAVNHGPEQFQQMMNELDREGGEFTPHFIARLDEQLHKEESALSPIQKWIESRTRISPFRHHPARPRRRSEWPDVDIDCDRKFEATLRTAIPARSSRRSAGLRPFCVKTRPAFMPTAILTPATDAAAS